MPNTTNTRMDEEALKELNWSILPFRYWSSLTMYLKHGVPPGHFLEAVLCNDLVESMGRADETSRQDLFQIVSFIYNEMPMFAWGSKEKYAAWISQA